MRKITRKRLERKSYEERIVWLAKQLDVSKETVEDLVVAKRAKLSNLITKEASLYLVAKSKNLIRD